LPAQRTYSTIEVAGRKRRGVGGTCAEKAGVDTLGRNCGWKVVAGGWDM